MKPSEYYQKLQQEKLIETDMNQLNVIHYLDELQHALMTSHQNKSSILSWLSPKKPIKGIYLWGGVGIGKTMLMDCFYQSLPFENKMRIHFHAFMRMVHSELKNLQGHKNPLKLLAKQIANDNLILCFDEFIVTEIADAMILKNLLHALFDHGVCLFATSNTVPEKLYYRGLQRQQFIPAISLIEKHTTVIHLPTTNDYRLDHLKHDDLFHDANDSASKLRIENIYSQIAANQLSTSDKFILVNEREIKINKEAGNIVWFDYQNICSIPRSQHDYLEIANRYKTVIITNIPQLQHRSQNEIILFIKLIDILYDAKICLIISADTRVDDLYLSGKYISEFSRTRSRLLEMQSDKYIQSINHHLIQQDK